MNMHVRHHAVRYEDAEIEQLAIWLREGHSASIIAKMLSAVRREEVTRNAIIGVVHRHKMLCEIGFAGGKPGRVRGIRAPAPKRTRVPTAAKPKRLPPPKRAKPPHVPHFKSPRAMHTAIVATEPGDREYGKLDMRVSIRRPIRYDLGDPKTYDRDSAHIALEQFTNRTCKWPVNDAAPGETHLFCGAVAPFEKPYCRHHAQRAVQCR